MGEGQTATIVALLGWVVFLPLGQLGWGRPLYAAVRHRLVKGRLGPEVLDQTLRITSRQAGAALCLFGVTMLGLAHHLEFTGSYPGLAALVIGMGTIGLATFWRDLAYATSTETQYEQFELIRRLTLLLSLGSLQFGIGPAWPGLACCVVGVLTHAAQAATIRRTANAAPGETSSPQGIRTPEMRRDARRFLGFTLSELFLYNAPLVVFTLVGNTRGLVEFSIWTKLYMFVVLPMRIIADTQLNAITAALFKGDVRACRGRLRSAQAMALVVVVVGLICMSVVQERLVSMIAPGVPWTDSWLPISLGLWSLANAVQHVFGSFTVSHGQGHMFAWRTSALTSIAVGLAVAGAQQFQFDLGRTLALAALPCCISAGAFAAHALAHLRRSHPHAN